MSESAEKYGNGDEKRPLTAVEWLEDVYNNKGAYCHNNLNKPKQWRRGI